MEGFSAFSNSQNRQSSGQRCPCPHVSRHKARRWLRAHQPRGFVTRPTAPYVHDAWAPGPATAAQRPRLRVAQPASRAAPRPAPPQAPACGLAREGGVEGKGAATPGRSARRPRGAPRAPHLPVAPATCPSRPQPDHSRPTLTAPAPPQPAKVLASSRLLRPAAARARGGRALSERDQSRRTAAAHWGSRERAEEAANRRRETRAAQLQGAWRTRGRDQGGKPGGANGCGPGGA